jgi:chromosome segregation ATPase
MEPYIPPHLRREFSRLEADLAEARAQLEAKDAALDNLDEAHKLTQAVLWQDIEELRASCASLRETKDTFFRNAEAWEAKCNAAWAERDRMEQEHQDFRLQNDAEWRAKLDHLKAQIAAKDAEIARLQKALLKCAAIPHMGQYTGSQVRAAIEESKPWSTPARETVDQIVQKRSDERNFQARLDAAGIAPARETE